jgi:peptidoglycan/xylan/chitin deacetylase (PgdA/CDA1 family)
MKQINLVLVGLVILVVLGFFAVRPSQNKTTHQTTSASILPLVASALAPAATAISRLAPASAGLKVPILMYHHVGIMSQGPDASIKVDPMAADLMVSPQDFEAQVQYFKNLGYHSVSVSQVYNALENKGPLPEKPIVFTFDDGFKDVFENAIPILEKYNYNGTFAVATQLLGRPTYAVWDDVITAQKSGMEIVSHTENHLDLTAAKYSDEDLKREIFGSKQILEEKLGIPVDFFVYPYGRRNAKVEQMVHDAGYKMAFTTDYGQHLKMDQMLSLPRVRVHGQDGLVKLMHIFEPWKFPKSAAIKLPGDFAPPSL